jgi:hypothetical protein
MRKKTIAIIVALILIMLFFWPKRIAWYDGEFREPPDRDCTCFGVKYDYYPRGTVDGQTGTYCSGIILSCETLCYNRTGTNWNYTHVPCTLLTQAP